MKFEVGDIVKYIGKLEAPKYCSRERGTVVEITKDEHIIVKFDGLLCCVDFEKGDLAIIEKVKKQTIVIKHINDTVTAYMGNRRAVATCSHDDEFDLYKGAVLALTRLLLEVK